MSSAWRSSSCAVLLRRRQLVLLEQADLDEIFGRHRKRDGVADRLVEAVIGAVRVQEGLLIIGALVEIVAELVVDGDEIVAVHARAHLDAQILVIVDVPGRGVADHLAVARLGDHRTRQKVSGSGAKPSEVKKPSPARTIRSGV